MALLLIRVPQPPIPIMKAIQIFRGILKGVFYLHSHGIVHGDLKVSNVMIENTWEELPTDVNLGSVFEGPSTPSLSRPESPYLSDSFGGESPWSPKPINMIEKKEEDDSSHSTVPDHRYDGYEENEMNER